MAGGDTGNHELELLRSKFFRTYASIPLNYRGEIVAIVDNQPISWAVANVEILGKTKTGEQILRRMAELKLLGD